MAIRPIDAGILQDNLTDIYGDGNRLVYLKDVLDLINEQPTLTPSNEWVSVDEKLPEPGERVLATDCGFVGEFYINERGQWQRYNVNCHALLMALDILYWMPLPAPPDKDNNVPIKAPNEPMLERVIREYLEICGNDCAGDPSVGIPECPFYQYADVLDNGALIQPKCELAAYRRPLEGEEYI